VALVAPYPAPRTTRKGGIPVTNVVTSGAGQPFTRVWQFRSRVGVGGTYNRTVSPAMTGPAIVKFMTLSMSAAPGAALLSSWQLGYSETVLQELRDAPVPAALPGTPIIDTSFNSDGPQTLPLPGGSMVGFIPQAGGPTPIQLDYIIQAKTFYLWHIWNAIQNADHSMEVSITVINAVGQDALSFFR
jgi:hypothetical protein